MKYTWSFDQRAFKRFKKELDCQMQLRIVEWLESHIEGRDNSRFWGKALTGSLGTFWRYQVGSYRIIADIKDNMFSVLAVKVGKRKDVYKRKS